MDKEKSFVSFVVYIHNDEDAIIEFLNQIDTYISAHFEKFEIICVDDGSTDNTVKRIKSFVSKGKSITIVDMGFYQGVELSMNAGVDISIGDFIYEFDSIDITYGLHVISEIFHECLQGNDIVSACPDRNRNIGSSLFYKLYNMVSKSQYKLQTDAFRVISRRAINRVRSMNHVLSYRKAVYANCGLVMKNHLFRPVSKGIHNHDSSYRAGLAIDAFVLYTSVAYRMAAFFTAFMLVMTIGISGYALVIRMKGIPIAGWTSMILVVCVGFLGLSIMIAILIKYTELILRTVFTHQKYIVKSIDRISR